MNIDLVLVPEHEKDHFSSLLNEYLKDHSRHQENRVGPETVEDYIYFQNYWSEAGRHPYYITNGKQTLGFVLVRTVFERDDFFYQVSEFYIRPAFQRKGYGRGSLSALWAMYPGRWELQVLAKNGVGKKFWSSCIGESAEGSVEVTEVEKADGMRCQFNFVVPHGL